MSSKHGMSESFSSRASWSPTPGLEWRSFYTPERKCRLLRMCLDHRDQFLEVTSDPVFWNHIQALFSTEMGQKVGDVYKRVDTMVQDRRMTLYARRAAPGATQLPISELEQAIDDWMAVLDQRDRLRKERAQAELVRENLTRSLSQKPTFQAVLRAIERVDSIIVLLKSLALAQERSQGTVQKKRKVREISREGDLGNEQDNLSNQFDLLREAMIGSFDKLISDMTPEIINRPSASTSATTQSTQDSASLHAQIAALEQQLQECRQDIRAYHEALLKALSELQKTQDTGDRSDLIITLEAVCRKHRDDIGAGNW